MKNILVVGGEGGVGSAFVKMLIERNDNVTVTVLNAKETGKINSLYGAKVPVYQVDLSDADRAQSSFTDIVNSMEHLHGVAMCAGYQDIGPAELSPIESYRNMIEINCLSIMALYKASVSALRKSKGHFLSITSTSGLAAMPFVGGYSLSKYAAEAMMHILRRESLGQGIRFCSIAPGWIRSPMAASQPIKAKEQLAELSPDHVSLYGHMFEGFREASSHAYDQNSSTPEEIAQVLIDVLNNSDPEPVIIPGEEPSKLAGDMSSMSHRELDAIMYKMGREQT